MPQQKVITIYRFSELPSERAKERAKADHFAIFGYGWSEEALESLKAFAGHFGARLKNYEIDWYNTSYSSCSFQCPELEPEELAAKVAELKHDGSCQFTGYCADDDANDGAVKAWNAGKRDLEEILQAGFRSWLKSAQDDAEGEQSDEVFSEHSDANNYTYRDNGVFEPVPSRWNIGWGP